MIVLIHKRQIAWALSFACFFCCFAAVLWTGREAAVSAFSPQSGRTVLIVDPGHGGEDGGAVSADGTAESCLNLEIALRLNDLLRLCGWETRMTRTEDVSVHAETAVTLRQKKASDLKNRAALVNSTANAVLVSIHQNSLPSSPQTHGAQVFWNHARGAEALAENIQEALNAGINRDGGKHAKQISAEIYLMKKIQAPGVLVECGFLSNGEETRLLRDPGHQRKLAVSILAGIRETAEEEA